MIRSIENINSLENLAQRGYLNSNDGQVLSIESHVDELVEHYTSHNASMEKTESKILKVEPIQHLTAPRRITFDTNPDDCNFSCIMCEQHSEHSPFQKERKDANIRRRRMDFDIIKKVVSETAPLGLQEIVSRCKISICATTCSHCSIDSLNYGRTVNVS